MSRLYEIQIMGILLQEIARIMELLGDHKLRFYSLSNSFNYQI